MLLKYIYFYMNVFYLPIVFYSLFTFGWKYSIDHVSNTKVKWMLMCKGISQYIFPFSFMLFKIQCVLNMSGEWCDWRTSRTVDLMLPFSIIVYNISFHMKSLAKHLELEGMQRYWMTVAWPNCHFIRGIRPNPHFPLGSFIQDQVPL